LFKGLKMTRKHPKQNQYEYIPSPEAERAHQWRKWLSIATAIGTVIYIILLFMVD
jgi:hypothetical protein